MWNLSIVGAGAQDYKEYQQQTGQWFESSQSMKWVNGRIPRVWCEHDKFLLKQEQVALTDQVTSRTGGKIGLLDRTAPGQAECQSDQSNNDG